MHFLIFLFNPNSLFLNLKFKEGIGILTWIMRGPARHEDLLPGFQVTSWIMETNRVPYIYFNNKTKLSFQNLTIHYLLGVVWE